MGANTYRTEMLPLASAARQAMLEAGRTLPWTTTGSAQHGRGLPQRGTLDQQFEELKRWEDEPKLRGSETGQAVAQVLDYIKILEKKSLGRGLSANGWRTSRTMLLERQQLRDFIGQISVSNDDFYVIAQNLLLPLFQERTQFLEDLEYDYDTMLEYGAYLPVQQGEA